MKKYLLSAIISLSCLILSSCGATDTPGENWKGVAPGMEDLSVLTDRTEYYDLTVESEPLFGEQNPVAENRIGASGGAGNYRYLGTQFLMGEPVQLRAEVSGEVSDIYLYRADGSSELVLENIPGRFVRSNPAYRWYLGREGDFYCIRESYYTYSGEGAQAGNRVDASIVKIHSSGEILYETALSDISIDSICQAEDGRVYVLLRDEADSSRTLREVDPATGKMPADFQVEIPYSSQVYLGIAAGGSPAVTGYGQNFSREIMDVSQADGSLEPILYFTGTSYGWHDSLVLQDFQALVDGSVEFLWTDHNGSDCFLERLRMEKVAKIPIVCRGLFRNNSWFEERVAWFNRESADYHVVLEDCGSGNDAEDFARLTSVQIGTGKGPDILYGYFLQDYIGGLLEKGALERLDPYLEASGIREEDYFPLTFNTWRKGDGIYSVTYRIGVWNSFMAEEVLSSRDTPDIETLADALLAWKGGGIWQEGLGSGETLNTFLEGSESLWGMVDWEAGSCDFNTSLFGKLLEIALRYGDDGRKKTESSICEERTLLNFFLFESQKELEAAGKVPCGVLFDDGCYTAAHTGYTMAVNANSSHKEGAWEFINFLIGEESQAADPDPYVQPVHRGVFDRWLQETVIYEMATAHSVNGFPYLPMYYGADISEEKQAEYRRTIEDARPLPVRTRPILTIILEEAEDYFNGSKSVDEVTKVINNRVQLYLDEGK